MALSLKSIFIPLAAAMVVALPASSSHDHHSMTTDEMGLAGQSMCSSANRQVRDVTASPERDAYLAEAKKSYQSALQNNDPAAVIDDVNALRFNLGLANGLRLKDPVDQQSYADIGATKESVLVLEQNAALTLAKNLAAKPRGEMTIFRLRSIESYLTRAGFDLDKGQGFDKIGMTVQNFSALKREYAIKDATKVAEAIKDGHLPTGFGRYQMEKDIMDAGFTDNEAWYTAIGSTVEEFKKNVQTICGQNDDCLIKEPGKNVLSHHLRGM